VLSVITCSNRPDKLKLAQDSLSKQTYKDFEWLVVSPVDPKVGKWVKDPPKGKNDLYCLNKAVNAGIKASTGDLLVLLQDSIWIQPDALEKFAFHFKTNPEAFVSGVGDQYDQLDDNGKPCHKVWLDPRKRSDMGSYYECLPQDWETNFCSLPRKAIYDVGGWDEEMDIYYAWDNVAVAIRLVQFGYKPYLDQTNESFTLKHGRSADWDENVWSNHDIAGFLKTRPIKLEYLG